MPGSVSGVVLAAGPSSRFAGEGSKLLLSIDGEPLVRRVVRRALASRLAEVVVVVGCGAREVSQALAGLAIRTVENPGYAAGQSSSVRAGLGAVAQGSAAAMFIPADQPGLATRDIDLLIAAFERSGNTVAVPHFRGRRGAPVIFAREHFPGLEALRGDSGGRQLLASLEGEVLEVELAGSEALQDIDTEADWREYLSRVGR